MASPKEPTASFNTEAVTHVLRRTKAVLQQLLLRERRELAESMRLDFNAELEEARRGDPPRGSRRVRAALCEAHELAERFRKSPMQTHAEWRRAHEEAERRSRDLLAERAAEQKGRRKPKGKQYNRVAFDLMATIAPDVEATFAAMVERYGPRAGKSFVVTQARRSGRTCGAASPTR